MESLMKVRLYVLNLFGNEMKAASFGRVLSKALEAAALKKLNASSSKGEQRQGILTFTCGRDGTRSATHSSLLLLS